MHPLNNKIIIGLTGGIGSGKTAVSNWFAAQGITVVDADVIAHQITQKDSPILDQIVQTFGDWALDDDGNYNRKAMRNFVFGKPDELAKLNQITHPTIHQQILAELQRSLSIYTLLSVPLLFEGRHKTPNLLSLCTRTLAVDVPIELQITRTIQRDNSSYDTVKSIIDQQISRQERLKLADDMVDNSGSLEELYQALTPLHQKYLSLATK